MTSNKPFALSVKVVILDDNGRCLLLKRSMASKGNPGKWEFPGGKPDMCESFEQALLREVTEETGLTISLLRPLGTAESESPLKRIVYLIMEARLISGQVILSDEHDDCIWIPTRELPHMDIANQFRLFVSTYSQR